MDLNPASLTSPSPASSPKPRERVLVDASTPEGDFSRKRKRRAAKRDRRRRKRDALKLEKDITEYAARAAQSERYQGAERLPTASFVVNNLRPTSNGFTGMRQPMSQAVASLTEVLQEGLRLQRWDGETPLLVEDAHARVFAVLAGRPVGDSRWREVVDGVDEALAQAETEVKTTYCKDCNGPSWDDRCAKCRNRRGDLEHLNIGVSFGGGQQVPGNLVNSRHDARAASKLIANKSILGLAGFINGAFAWYAPRLYRHYASDLDKLFAHHPHLQRIFSNIIFPAAASNLGPQVTTLEHTDTTNLPFGWCAIYAGGNYDPTLGGHLILRDLNLVIESPPGSVVFIPSGTLRHGNTAVQEHETRRSFTQFAPGGLFRWVFYGFRTDPCLQKEDKERWTHSYMSAPTRIRDALRLFSTADSLHRNRVALAT